MKYIIILLIDGIFYNVKCANFNGCKQGGLPLH